MISARLLSYNEGLIANISFGAVYSLGSLLMFYAFYIICMFIGAIAVTIALLRIVIANICASLLLICRFTCI